jgi:DNA polymerase/3'-5' exonuclease PolX
VAAYPGIHDIIAKGENKVSFYLGNRAAGGCAPAAFGSYGAALQYFTGSKAHNVALRQRALKMGYTLSEWALARLDDELRGRRGHRGRDLRRAGHGLDASRAAREPGRNRGRRAPQLPR